MIGTLLIIAKYLYDDFLVMYFYQRVLGRKYSVEITIGATIVWWLSQCISKLAVWLGIGLVMVEILQYWGLISYLLYGVLVYKSAIRQRILAVVMIVILFMCTELLVYVPASILTGEFTFMQVESTFTLIGAFLQIPLELVDIYLLIRLWKWIEKVEWKNNYQLWVWLIFPLSQLCYMVHVGLYYSMDAKTVPGTIFIGLVLGFAADIYMCVLFVRNNRRERVEKELSKLKIQYEMERFRYEELMKTEEEMKKIRHDFQNYCIAMKNM